MTLNELATLACRKGGKARCEQHPCETCAARIELFGLNLSTVQQERLRASVFGRRAQP
jgi:hypothetical protein